MVHFETYWRMVEGIVTFTVDLECGRGVLEFVNIWDQCGVTRD